MLNKKDRILIVDDEKTIRKLLKQKLTSEGFQCLEAGDAKRALQKLCNNAIGLVLLDIRMPGKSGVELLPEIKALYPHISVIMITAITDMQIAVQCMKQGAYDYVTKPFELDDVTIGVGRALEKRRLELETEEYRQHLEEKVTEQANKIRVSFLNSITSLAYALEAKDAYTSGHSQKVADISVAIAKELDLPSEDIEKIRLAGLVHDIGKLGVKESVLNKPDRLTDEEFRQIQNHSEMGEHILAPIAGDSKILKMVRNHHERYDGTGYPDRLKGDQIPLCARIITVSDAYEAMTSERPYRSKMSDEEARGEISRSKGTQFDPEVADAFLRCASIYTSGMLKRK